MNNPFHSLLLSVLLLTLSTSYSSRAEDLGTTEEKLETRSAGYFLLADSSVGDAFLRVCMQKYGSKAVEEVKNRLDTVNVCLENIFYPSDGNLVSRILATGSTSNVMKDAPIETLCNNRIPDIEKCIQPFITALKGCTNSEGVNDLVTLNRAFLSVVNYACQDKGDRILKFVVERGPECLKENGTYDKLTNCFKYFGNSFMTSLQRNSSVFNQVSCRVYLDQNDCVARAFENCNSFAIRDIVQGLINTITNETRCFNREHQQGVNEGRNRLCNNIILFLCLVVLLFSTQHKMPILTF